MISKFRKSANNIFVQLFLALIAFSFVGIGAVAYMKGNSQGYVVTFSNAKSISAEEFYQVKKNIINNLQQNSGIEFNQETIADLNIDYMVLTHLINKSMVGYLADLYNLDVSDKKVVEYIKKNPAFHDDQGQFDIDRFKASFRNSTALQQKYLENEKYKVIESIIFDIFRDSLIISELQLNNLTDKIAEKKVVDIVSMDLYKKRAGHDITEITEEELYNFYKKNTDKFTNPEKRKFQYLKIDKNFIQKKIEYSQKDLNNYFVEHIDDFESENFNDVKSEVEESYLQDRMLKFLNELCKNLEEDIAYGMEIGEIASKYELKIHNVDGLSYVQMSSSKNTDYLEIADVLFDMEKDELSYPIEIEDKSEIIIVHLRDIAPTKLEKFEQVKEAIRHEISLSRIANDNMKYFSDLGKNYKSSIRDEFKKNNDLRIVSNFAISKYQLLNNSIQDNSLPSALMHEIIERQASTSTKIHTKDNKIYFAYVTKSLPDNKLALQIRKNSSSNYIESIRGGIYLELMQYLTSRNKMQIQLPAN
ncbi:MAG TPA: SurA N-terminal domain-containing protein [Candidatus Megaira endosymbiont of Nemacystus decipiens]|nr:SurA N-terminal domain-containing protein [Candidatus Megaera endosymbiont of Nemacystus decipiens]